MYYKNLTKSTYAGPLSAAERLYLIIALKKSIKGCNNEYYRATQLCKLRMKESAAAYCKLSLIVPHSNKLNKRIR